MEPASHQRCMLYYEPDSVSISHCGKFSAAVNVYDVISSDHQCALIFLFVVLFLIHVNVELLVVRNESSSLQSLICLTKVNVFSKNRTVECLLVISSIKSSLSVRIFYAII